MNASSSLGLPTMEDPFTDTMEMASPYAGHVDDFEIDIDIMDDQPANVDNDFDLQDASPTDANDADMMEDAPEMTVTDTTQYNDASNVQYTNATLFPAQEEPVESEMVDEEYENTEGFAPIVPQDEVVSTEQGETVTTEQVEAVRDVSTNDAPKHEEQDRDVETTEEVKVQTSEQENFEQKELDQQGNEPIEDVPHIESVTEPHPTDNTDHPEHHEHVHLDTTVTEELKEQHVSNEVLQTETDKTNMLPQSDKSNEAVDEERTATTEPHIPYFHPVKVIYQESEISMFPPRDGDTSETYFLANEALAHETIDRLLKECRTILGDHASHEDSLVFHIDSLGIELSEDDIHSSKVNLFQIVEIYLHLCRNSGIESPEPMYITLNTRPNLSAELAGLANAANEGKGISDIRDWEEEYEHHESEDGEGSSDAALSEQQVDHDEQVQTGKEHLLEGEQNYKETHHQTETESDDKGQPGEGQTSDKTSGANVETTKIKTCPKDVETDVVNGGEGQPDDLKAPSEPQYDFEETNSTSTLTQQQLTVEAEDQQQEESLENAGQLEADRGDKEGFDVDEHQVQSSSEHGVVPESRGESKDQENHGTSDYEDENSDAKDKLTGVGEGAVATQDGHEKISREDYGDVEQEYTSEHEEDDYYGHADQDGQEGYEEEYHEKTIQENNDVCVDYDAGNDDAGEPLTSQPGKTDEFQTADRFDQVSSDTVSVSNGLPDKNDGSSDSLQNLKQKDTSEGADGDFQQFAEFPDLPDDDLFSLDGDFAAETEEAVDDRETHDDSGVVSQVGQKMDAFVDQALSADTNIQHDLERQESNTGKRPRVDEEEEIDFDGSPSPGTKRTRSS